MNAFRALFLVGSIVFVTGCVDELGSEQIELVEDEDSFDTGEPVDSLESAISNVGCNGGTVKLIRRFAVDQCYSGRGTSIQRPFPVSRVHRICGGNWSGYVDTLDHGRFYFSPGQCRNIPQDYVDVIHIN